MIKHLSWLSVGVIILLGVGLISNPLYLYPNGTDTRKTTYKVSEISNESTAQQALGKDQRVLTCPVERPCVLEERVLEEGPVRYDESLQRGQPYPAVLIDGGTYLPVTEVENRTTTLSLEAVTAETAVRNVAISTDELQPEVLTAVETGSVTVYDDRIEAFERGWIVEHDGRYYWNDGFRSTGTTVRSDVGLLLLRGVLFALGITLIGYAGWTLRDLVGRTD